MAVTFLILLVGFVVIAQASDFYQLQGRIGTQRFNIDIEFNDHEMIVTISQPENAPANFRETTNLHIFSSHLLTTKNVKDKECYVRFFVESEDLMRGRVQNAVYNNGIIGNVTEEILVLDDIPPLSNRTVNVLLGSRVASFCQGFDVFAIGPNDYIRLDQGGSNDRFIRRRRAAQRAIEAAGVCRFA